MQTESHYVEGGEPHYKRVARLGLSWCKANITKYAERTKGSDNDDTIKIIDYAIMELEGRIFTEAQAQKLRRVGVRFADLISSADKSSRPIAGYGSVSGEAGQVPMTDADIRMYRHKSEGDTNVGRQGGGG